MTRGLAGMPGAEIDGAALLLRGQRGRRHRVGKRRYHLLTAVCSREAGLAHLVRFGPHGVPRLLHLSYPPNI